MTADAKLDPLARPIPAALVKHVVGVVDDTLAASTHELLAASAERTRRAPNAARPVQADPVLEAFYANTRSLKQAEIDYLIKRQAVPIMALAEDGDGAGWPLSAARVIYYSRGNRFDFADDSDDMALSAIIIVLRNAEGYPLDIAAWSPKTGMLGTFQNRALLVGEHELEVPRFECSLTVHREMIGWLRAGRLGVLILNEKQAWRLLHDLDVAAADVEHGLELRKVLRPPPARIAVPEKVRA